MPGEAKTGVVVDIGIQGMIGSLREERFQHETEYHSSFLRLTDS
jgi:hypothetical protein